MSSPAVNLVGASSLAMSSGGSPGGPRKSSELRRTLSSRGNFEEEEARTAREEAEELARTNGIKVWEISNLSGEGQYLFSSHAALRA